MKRKGTGPRRHAADKWFNRHSGFLPADSAILFGEQGSILSLGVILRNRVDAVSAKCVQRFC